MRRSGQPSLPSAMTCCFFASFKTLLMPTEPIRSRRNQCPGRRYPLAGFEVIIIGRFWVITEAWARERRNDESLCSDRSRNETQSLGTRRTRDGRRDCCRNYLANGYFGFGMVRGSWNVIPLCGVDSERGWVQTCCKMPQLHIIRCFTCVPLNSTAC